MNIENLTDICYDIPKEQLLKVLNECKGIKNRLSREVDDLEFQQKKIMREVTERLDDIAFVNSCKKMKKIFAILITAVISIFGGVLFIPAGLLTSFIVIKITEKFLGADFKSKEEKIKKEYIVPLDLRKLGNEISYKSDAIKTYENLIILIEKRQDKLKENKKEYNNNLLEIMSEKKFIK